MKLKKFTVNMWNGEENISLEEYLQYLEDFRKNKNLKEINVVSKFDEVTIVTKAFENKNSLKENAPQFALIIYSYKKEHYKKLNERDLGWMLGY